MAAGKKRVDHVAWQIEVATNEEWDELLKLQGLIVLDVYSEWCGPCTAMASHLKEIKLQLGDDLLHCALAKSDAINQLVRFRSRSEPTWLFLAGGEPVAMIRGANAPLIRKTLLAELQIEKDVLGGSRQRVTLSWDSLEVPSNDVETDNHNNAEQAELKTAPENWLEMDALVLQGSFRLIVDQLMQLLAERNMEVAAKSAVRLHRRDTLILWFPSSVEDENLAEWFDTNINQLIAKIQPINEKQEEVQPEEEETAEADVPEEAEENAESTEESNAQHRLFMVSEAVVEEGPKYEPIEFRLVAEPEEKESLIKQIQEPEEDGPEVTDNAVPLVEEPNGDEEEEQQQQQEPQQQEPPQEDGVHQEQSDEIDEPKIEEAPREVEEEVAEPSSAPEST